MYVNDAIGYRMTPEQPLYYSDNCFGTADAIQFKNNVLRIHDYKSGIIPAKMEQLKIYAALFCLEYKVKPGAIRIELRIYQNDDVVEEIATAEDILPIALILGTSEKATVVALISFPSTPAICLSALIPYLVDLLRIFRI